MKAETSKIPSSLKVVGSSHSVMRKSMSGGEDLSDAEPEEEDDDAQERGLFNS